jgi:hypothetical protein
MGWGKLVLQRRSVAASGGCDSGGAAWVVACSVIKRKIERQDFPLGSIYRTQSDSAHGINP